MGVLGSTEEALKRSGVGVGVVMGVLKLVNVANEGEVLPVVVLFSLEWPEASEYSLVRFINFHKLQIQEVEQSRGEPQIIMVARDYQGPINVQQVIKQPMNLGQMMAVFFCVAFFLLTLFCLLLRYFHYRAAKRKKEEAERFRSEELPERVSTFCLEGAYQEFCDNRLQRRKETLRESLIEEDKLIEQPDIKKIFDVSSNIYSLSSLHQQLAQESPLHRIHTDRSLAPIHEFKLDKINTSHESKHSSLSSCFKFVKQLTRYDRSGIHLVDVIAVSMRKLTGQYLLEKTLQESFVSKEETDFQDLLQSYGYDLCGYGCSRLLCEVNVGQVVEGKVYSLKNLESKEYKEEITLEEYEQAKCSLQDPSI